MDRESEDKKAARRYDANDTSGAKFATYAVWSIIGHIRQRLAELQSIIGGLQMEIAELKRKPMSSESNPFFDLDKNNLDEEWVAHVRKYYAASKDLADANREHEIAKAALEVSYAECSRAVRSMPDRYNIEKVTEEAVRVAITTHPKYRVAVQKEIDARHDKEVKAIAVQTLDQAKYALLKLTDLFLSEYWTREPVPKKAKDEFARTEEDKIFGKRKPSKGGGR